jgi:hypothetical protein
MSDDPPSPQQPPQPRDPYPNPYQRPYVRPRPVTGRRSEGLADLLERILDKGLVVAGDIQLNLLDIELITIKIRLLVASADTAQQMGIDWWRHDPFLSNKDRELAKENAILRSKLEELTGSEEPDPTEQLAEENTLLREHVRRLQMAIERGGEGVVETHATDEGPRTDVSQEVPEDGDDEESDDR